MEIKPPHVRTIPLKYAPGQAPCPTCGKLGTRKDILHRQVRSIAYKQVVYLDLTSGEDRTRCDCCTTFRTTPPGVDPRALYDNKVPEAVLDRILEDGMSVERVLHAMHRDFFLDLSDGFVSDCLDHEARRLDMADHRRFVLERFRGTLCVDELHLGRSTLLLATDPLNDLPVAFAVVRSNDQDHMERFLKNLKAWGFAPEVVVTDGSDLYPKVLAAVWPQARHQLGIFPVLKDAHQQVLDALRRLRRDLARRGNRGRKRKRGRPRRHRPRRRSLTLKEQAAFVFKRRYLIVKRRDEMSRQDRLDLETMFQYLAELRRLREVVDRLANLFEARQSEATAWRRHAALVNDPAVLAIPEFAQAVTKLAAEKFAKMIAFLNSPVFCRRERTNNHVERINRKLRYEEKARYKWRKRRTLVRFLVLLMDRHWRQERARRHRWPDEAEPENVAQAASRPASRPRAA